MIASSRDNAVGNDGLRLIRLFTHAGSKARKVNHGDTEKKFLRFADRLSPLRAAKKAFSVAPRLPW